LERPRPSSLASHANVFQPSTLSASSDAEYRVNRRWTLVAASIAAAAHQRQPDGLRFFRYPHLLAQRVQPDPWPVSLRPFVDVPNDRYTNANDFSSSFCSSWTRMARTVLRPF